MRVRGVLFAAVVAALVGAVGVVVSAPPAAGAEDVGDITTFTAANVDRPYEIALGPDRNLWFTSRDADRIGRITVNGTISLFRQATGTHRTEEPSGITGGPDGRIWYTLRERNRIGRMTTAGTQITSFGNANIDGPRSIVTGPDGALWFTSTDNGRLGRITTAGAVTTFGDPDLSATDGIAFLALGADDNLWLTATDPDALWRFDPDTATFSDFALPAEADHPRLITAGPDGRLWFAAQSSDRIASIDPLAGDDAAILDSLETYADPADQIVDPQGVTAAADGNIWFTSSTNSRVGFLDPDAPDPASTITTFADPATNIDGAFAMATGSDGHPWFTVITDDRIGQVRATNCNTDPFPHGFTDITGGAYYEDPVDWAKCHGLISGFPDNTYRPDDDVNRGQVVSIIWVMMDSPSGSPAHGFPDIPANVFYERGLRWAKAQTLVTGFPNGTYRPRDPVNHCQFTNMLWRLVGSPTSYPDHPYTDVAANAFCRDAIDWAHAEGLWADILTGTTFAPKAGTTRAEVADVLSALASTPSAWSEFTGDLPDTIRFP